jgi:DNA polymerase I-like protein with 3'-5' exonuclease and polymerase domains
VLQDGGAFYCPKGIEDMIEGNIDTAKILIVSDFQRPRELAANQILSGERRDILVNSLSSAGILASDYAITMLGDHCKSVVLASKANIIVPLGSKALKWLVGHDNISKHHLSLYKVKAEFGNRKSLPLLHPESIQKSYSDIAYIRWGAMKLKQEMNDSSLSIPVREIKTSLDLSFPQIVAYLEGCLKLSEISTDIETDYSGVNTVGIAISPTDAIAIESRPDRWKPIEFHKLWDLYRQIWESEYVGKIAQNALFEMWWASVYGIGFNNVSFDTMLAMKYLHPTLERGLDNVGRIYTRYTYSKDGLGDWANVSSWRDHLLYNGADTTGQFAAKVSMQEALKSRGLLDSFRNLIMPQVQMAHSMQTRGLRLDKDMHQTAFENASRDIEAIEESFKVECNARLSREINVKSPKQVKDALKELGIKIPTAKGKETVSRSALMKLKNKHPKEMLIRDLIKIGELRKKTDECLNFECDPDGRVRFSMDLASTENGLWAGKKSVFNRGFDPTNLPQVVKHCIVADEGAMFIEVKLRQPELRYIAQAAPDYKLQGMLAEYKNVGKFVASKLFRKHEEMVDKVQIRIAEQVIKAANEMDAPKMLVERIFSRTGIFYTDMEAKRFMAIFLEEFEGCRKRIDAIRKQIYTKRMLTSPTRQIVYYDRVNDSLLRRALSWGPETYANDQITNLMLELSKHPVEFVMRNGTTVLLQVKDSDYQCIGPVIMELLGEHHVEVKFGNRWGSLENV